MKNYYIIMLLWIVASSSLFAQSFELQLIHSGGGILTVQMRETSGSGTPTTADFVTDLNFAIIWSQTCGDVNLSVVDHMTAGHANYDVALSGTRESINSGVDYLQTLRSVNLPFSFPENWTTNNFITIATLQVSQTGSGVCDFCTATMDILADDTELKSSAPNFGLNLTDYPPIITNGKATAVPLPVELTSFKAKENNRQVDLTWTSAAEIDFDGYHVERSKDGKNFHEIAWVNGIGSPTTAMSYSHQDKDITGGTTYYYRLAMRDLDASVEYSAIEAVHVHSKFSVQAFPKPTRELLNLRVQSEVNSMAKTQLVDICGRIVYENVLEIEKGNNEFTIQDASIPNGIYMLIIRGEGWQHAEEVVFID